MEKQGGICLREFSITVTIGEQILVLFSPSFICDKEKVTGVNGPHRPEITVAINRIPGIIIHGGICGC